MASPTLSAAGRLTRRWWNFSHVGLLFGAAWFLASWAPSLLPRTWYYQGLISGLSAAFGYGLGVLVAWLVRHVARLLQMRITVGPEPAAWLRVAGYVFGALVVVVITITNVRAQGRTAAVVHLPALGPFDWLRSIALAAAIAALLVGVARLLRRLTRRLAEAAGQVLPRAIASAVAVVIVVVVTLWVSDNVLFHRGMQGFASIAAQVDAKSPEGRVAPTSALISGGPGSLESYDSLGYEGQFFVTSAPTAAEISAATGAAATEPIRVYAGLSSGRSIDAVADGVVAELERTHAFDRKVLAVITSTGTGWVDDWSVQAIEYLSDGDSAVASMQYSFLPSAMAVLTDRATPREAGKALFDRVHARWAQLPEGKRPQLVVGGESLGSYGGQAAFADARDMLARAQGGVWVGTPSFTDVAHELTAARNLGSPEIAPVIKDGRNIRFVTAANQITKDYYGRPYGAWDFPRFVYAQHPSDPVVWWDPALLGAEPDWLREPLGRDVNPAVSWIPFVTFWQLTTDMAVGHDPPDGYGHRYGAELVASWAAVLGDIPGQDHSALIAGITATVSRTE